MMKMKETFCSYMDIADENTRKMNEEIEQLKNELVKTRNIVRVQRVRYQQLVSLFNIKMREKEEESRNDLHLKHVQLTQILRFLHVLESKLRKEQNLLKTSLSERDTVIRNQEIEIAKLKNELQSILKNDRCTCRCAKIDSKLVQDNIDNVNNNVETTITSDSAADVNHNNKPDLINCIGIKYFELDTDDSPKSPIYEPDTMVNSGQETDENTFVISSLEDYDASLSSLRVKGMVTDSESHSPPLPVVVVATKTVENIQDVNNENICNNEPIDQEIQNETCKFKMEQENNCNNGSGGGDVVGNNCLESEIAKDCSEDNISTPYYSFLELEKISDENSNSNKNVEVDCSNVNRVEQEVMANNSDSSMELKIATENEHSPDNHSSFENTNNVTTIENMTPKYHPIKPPKPNLKFDSSYQRIFSPNKLGDNHRKGLTPNVTQVSLVDKSNIKKNAVQKSPQKHTNDVNIQNTIQPKADRRNHITSIEFVSSEELLDNVNNTHNISSSMEDKSKIVQTVSEVLSNLTESKDDNDDDDRKTLPTVSQMVRRFEELKSKKKSNKRTNVTTNVPKQESNVLQINFEEFYLVDKEIESTFEDIVKDNSSAVRLEAEGQENTINSSSIETACSDSAKYETFLEITGLSQKSILTPSRILSNHRNVVKPKDVKYRNRVKAAAIGEKCNNGTTVISPTIKYWTEPYL